MIKQTGVTDQTELDCQPAIDTLRSSTKQEADLYQRVRLFLTGSNLPGLHYIDVEVRSGTVNLRGRVRTFYEKQLAVRLSSRVAGVIRVVDHIDVRGYTPRNEIDHLGSWREGRVQFSDAAETASRE